jgi:hypothetical protein
MTKASRLFARPDVNAMVRSRSLNPDIREQQRQEDLMRQADRERLMGPVQPRGKDRLATELKRNPHKPGSVEYDRWVIGLREVSDDPEFNIALRSAQGPAFRREQMRSEGGLFGQRDSDPDVTPEGFSARQQIIDRPRSVIVGPDGEPVPDQFTIGVDGSIVPAGTELAAGVDPTLISGEDAVRSGQFVWMGGMGAEEAAGRFGTVPVVEDAYMSANDAVLLPYRWTPAQIAYAQEAMGLDITGFADQAVINGWAQVVASAAGYAQAGRRVDPFMLLDMVFDATQAASRGGGGGGGGGGGTAFSVSETTAFLNSVMLEEAGREATNQEAEQFNAAFNGAGEVDPTQFAVDWVRSIAGGEAGTFQAATDYYQAMLAVLGANTQAEGGP